MMIRTTKKSERDLEKEAAQRAKERFKDYTDVNIQFGFPEGFEME